MKMSMTKRVLTLVLAMCLVLGMLPATSLLREVQAATAQWQKIAGNANGVLESGEDPADATLTNYVTAYYTEQIPVEKGTRISFKIHFPNTEAGKLLQYGFALVNRAGCFYTSNATATNLMLEVVSNTKTMTFGASKYLGSRTLLEKHQELDAARSTETVYTVTYEKIDVTEGDVNYSWLLTATNGTKTFTYRYKASDVPHDAFNDGAYVAVGSMAGSTTHTLAVTDLTVVQPEADATEPSPDTPTDKWEAVTGRGDNSRIEADANNPANATFKNYVNAYYTQHIPVQEGTKVSFKVTLPVIDSTTTLQYGFSLIDVPNTFYQSGSANALSVELASSVSNGAQGALKAVVTKKVAGGSNRAFLYNVPTALSSKPLTTGIFTITFEKLNQTVDGVEYSWKITVDNRSSAQVVLVKAADVAQDLLSNGVYLAMGSMTSASNHHVRITDLTVTQPAQPEVTEPVATEPPATEPPATEPPATEPPATEPHQGWNAIDGAASRIEGTEGSADALFSNYIKAYYNQLIEVRNGTKISFKLQLPTIAEGANLQYGVSLMDTPGSFHDKGAKGNGLTLELQSNANVSWSLRGVVSVKSPAVNRTWKYNVKDPLAAKANTSDVYTVTFEKINKTVDGVEYSWSITVSNGSASQVTLVKASDFAHANSANGVYLALGSMTSVCNHALKLTGLTVTQPGEGTDPTDPTDPTEPDVTEPPATEPDPTEPPATEPVVDGDGWNAIAGAGDRLVIDGTKPGNVQFNDYITAYYNQRIDVAEGTTITFKVSFPKLAKDVNLHFGFSLVDMPKSYYQSDTLSNALSIELQGNTQSGDKWPLRAVTSRKVAGGAQRAWLANVTNPLAADRNTTDVYTITFQKVNITVGQIEYSWAVTVDNGVEKQTVMYKAQDIPHDLFENGLYLAAGSMNNTSGHSVKLTDLSVTVEEPMEQPDPDKEGWNVVAGSDDRLTAGTTDPFEVELDQYVTAYLNQKIDVTLGTTISFTMTFPKMAAGASFHYGFSLVDMAKSFYQSDNLSNALSVEVQSVTEVEGKWPVRAVVSKKVAGVSQRAFVGNITNPLANDRSDDLSVTITFLKINETIAGENYSWLITVNNGYDKQQYMVKAADAPHDLFAEGAYLAAGSMTSASGHTVRISGVSVSVQDPNVEPEKDPEGWNVIGGSSDRLTVEEGQLPNATFKDYITAYFNDKINVTNGTVISFDVMLSETAAGEMLQYGFSLVDRADSFHNSDILANSITMELQSSREVNEKWPVYSVFSVKPAGSARTWIANMGGGWISADRDPNAVYTITFYKVDATVMEINYSWYVTVSNGKDTYGYGVPSSLVPHDQFANGAYLALGSMTSKSAHTVKISNLKTELITDFNEDLLMDLSGIWKIVRGYQGQQGAGLSYDNGSIIMGGYGGLSYQKGSVTNAAAVEFDLNNYESSGYFFSFGVVNKANVYYNPNGQESQGIYVRISAWNNGNGMNIKVFNLTAAGSDELGTIVTNKPPKGTKHILSIYQEDGVWYVAIDGFQKMKLDMEVDLGEVNYLVAGASQTSELTMTVHNVYLDDDVTAEMKAGALVEGGSVNTGDGGGNENQGSGGTSNDGNQGGGNQGGDGDFNTATNPTEPDDNILDQFEEPQQDNSWLIWVIAAAAAAALAIVAVAVVLTAKKKSGK